MSILPWFIKYKPTKFTELQFTDDSGFHVLEWLRNAQKGSILNLFGSIGTGKTCLVYAAAKALKYNVIEYDSINPDDLKAIGRSKNFDNSKSLLLVDESDIPFSTFPQRFFNLNVPVIFTTHTLANKEVKAIKIQHPNSEYILNAIRNILKIEKRSLDERFILRLCEVCNYDFRLVINYCQVFSKSPNIKDLGIVDKVVSQNIASSCRAVLSKRMPLIGLESIYSEKLLNLCLSSVLENNKDPAVLKAIEYISEFADYPDKFKFISIDSLNKLRSDFIYKKEDIIISENFHGHEDPLHFLPLYHRNLQNTQSIRHLQAIFTKYQIDQLSVVDKEIKDYMGFSTIESKTFKYKHSMGSSSAIKRDISLKEIIDL